MPHTRSLLIAGATVLALAAPAGSAVSVAPGSSGSSGSSPSGTPQWTGFGPCAKPALADFECGTLTVRLDRRPGSRDRRTLDLSVLQGGNPDADRTMLVLTGGPGQPGPEFAPRLLPAFDAIKDDYRFVMLDQRGTGDQPLVCPELQDERGYSDLAVPTEAAVKACAEALGSARAHYKTADSVADFEDLRRALGVRRWAVNGVSYGTFSGQRYAAAHRDRVTHLVLDSTVPVTGFDAQLVELFNEFARVMRDVCGVPTRDCPGDPAEDLSAVLADHPDLGPPLLDIMTTAAYGDPAGHFDMPERLHAGANGDIGPIEEIIELVDNGNGAPANVYSQAVQAATLCADLSFPWGGADSSERVRDRLADRAARRHTKAALFPFNAQTARGNGEMRMCEWWPRVRDPRIPASQLSLRGVNALLVHGERDLGTPLIWAKRAHRHIPGSELIVVPDAGHSILAGRRYPEVNRAVADFLLDR